LAAAGVALVAFQAAAVGKAGSHASRFSAAAPRAKLAARGQAEAAAVVDGRAATVSCGKTLTANTTLTADLNCSGGGNALTLGANGIVLNLNGHFVSGTGSGDGIFGLQKYTGDTVENGYVIGFEYGVFITGANTTLTKLQVVGASGNGVWVATEATNSQVVANTFAENQTDGILVGASGVLIKGNHLLNNGAYGMFAQGGGMQISGNVANGNTREGMLVVSSPPATIGGNTANYNGALGTNAQSPQIDGGTNAAKGNTNQVQCRGIVCS
jgi:hypothetical protein